MISPMERFHLLNVAETYSLDQLANIKTETVLFLQGLLDGMKQYYDEKQYQRN